MPADPPSESPRSFGPYRVLRQPCPGSEHLIIALHGAGNPARPDAFEFAGRIARLRQDAILVKDTARSWYNAGEGWSELVGFVRAQAAARPYRSVTLLGVSMGAYGALQLAEALPEARVVAMSPPPLLTREAGIRRYVRFVDWLQEREDAALPRPRARILGDPARYLLLFGDEDPADILCCEAFFHAGWPRPGIVPGGVHNLPQTLKQRSRYDSVSRLMMTGAPLPEVAEAAGAFPAGEGCAAFLLRRARALVRARQPEAAAELLDRLGGMPDARSPSLALVRMLHHAMLGERMAAAEWLPQAVCRSLSLPLGPGGSLELTSPVARVTPAGVKLGPIAAARLAPPPLPPGAAAWHLSLRPNGNAALLPEDACSVEAFGIGAEGPVTLARSAGPEETLRLPLPPEGLSFHLFCPRFISLYDQGLGTPAEPEGMLLRDVALEPG